MRYRDFFILILKDYAVWKADAVKMEKTLKKAVKTERMKGLQLSDDEGVRPEEQLVFSVSSVVHISGKKSNDS